MAPVNSADAEKAAVNESKDKVSMLPQDELYVIDKNGEEHQMTPEELATEIEKKGKFVFTNNIFRSSSLLDKARAAYAKKYPELDMSNVYMGYRIDLLLGSKDNLRNIAQLDGGVNRSIGAQINQAKKVVSDEGIPHIDFNYIE